MAVNELYLSKVSVSVSRFTGFMYTAEPTKTILINAVEKLAEQFKPRRGLEPKLIHITPLYSKAKDGRTVCIYSYVSCRPSRRIIKCEGSPQPVILDGEYHFYVGFHTNVLAVDEFLRGVVERGNSCIDFMSQKVCI